MSSRRSLLLSWLVVCAGCVASEDPGQLVGGVPPFGNGSDGIFDSGGNGKTTELNTNPTPLVGSAGAQHVSVGSSMGFVAGQTVLLHDSQGTQAGHWELVRVAAVAGTTLTLTRALAHDYPASDHAQALIVPQLSDVNVRAGDNVTGPNWDGMTGGIVAFAANGTVTIAGSLYQSGAGFRGATHHPQCPNNVYQCMPGKSGESSLGPSLASSMPNGAGGGGGGAGECNEGGGGSYGSAGSSPGGGMPSSGCSDPSAASPGVAGTVAGDPDLRTTILFGGAGGEGGGDDNSVGPGPGGNGGGIIMIFAPTIVVSGRVDVSGDDGHDGIGADRCATGCGSGGGGGGAGGAIYFATQRLTITGTVIALGGKGGNCSCMGGGWRSMESSGPPGGVGGVGRIAAHGAIVNGATNPPLVTD
jgi:hypothetical protein